jgi:hypothetical protein
MAKEPQVQPQDEPQLPQIKPQVGPGNKPQDKPQLPHFKPQVEPEVQHQDTLQTPKVELQVELSPTDEKMCKKAEPSDVWCGSNSSRWLRPAQCAGCKAPPRIALAYRGDYHRKAILLRGPNRTVGCSNFFSNIESHWKHLVRPLEAAGSSVKTYFHTYRGDLSCPQLDDRLVRELRPVRYRFSSHSSSEREAVRENPLYYDDEDEDEVDESENAARVQKTDYESEDDAYEDTRNIAQSLVQVLELVLEDEQSVDAVVLTRFDLKYRAPITSLNVWWNVTNAAHVESVKALNREGRVSDIFFVLPIAHVRPFMKALDASVRHKHNHKGAAHWVWWPLAGKLGLKQLHIIDTHQCSSHKPPSRSPCFTAISRACGVDYGVCPSASALTD